MFSSRYPVDMNIEGLSQAGIWNYLREEITVALECKRQARIGFDFDFDPRQKYSDSMRANIMSHILARIINHCFAGERASKELDDWVLLENELTAWKASLPASFEPYSNASITNNPFPSFWLIHPWHGRLSRRTRRFETDIMTVAAQQYFSIAKILLALYNPSGYIDRDIILENTLRVCGMAYTNENTAARVNAFGPLAFCQSARLLSNY